MEMVIAGFLFFGTTGVILMTILATPPKRRSVYRK